MQKMLFLTLLLAPNYTRHRSSACTVAVHLRVEAEMSRITGVALIALLALAFVAACQERQHAATPPEAPQIYRTIDGAKPFAIRPQFDSARDFREGLAAVRIGDDKTGRWG